MSNSIIDNQIDFNFILECIPPTVDERMQATIDILEFNRWYVLGSLDSRFEEEKLIEENINRRILNTRKRLNRVLNFNL